MTDEVKNGILCHTSGEDAYTLEGQIIRIADKIAYINHDIDDAIQAGVMAEEDIPLDIRMSLGMSKSERINNMVLNVINNSDDKILMDDDFGSCLTNCMNLCLSQCIKIPFARVRKLKLFK